MTVYIELIVVFILQSSSNRPRERIIHTRRVPRVEDGSGGGGVLDERCPRSFKIFLGRRIGGNATTAEQYWPQFFRGLVFRGNTIDFQ